MVTKVTECKTEKNLNNQINTLNKEQRKIFDEMLDITEDKQTFLNLYGRLAQGKHIFSTLSYQHWNLNN